MKKIVLIVSFALCGLCSMTGAQLSLAPLHFQIELTDVNPSFGKGERPRTPIACPSVAQDGHTLYFNNVDYDQTLILLDENGVEVYTTFVSAGTTAVILPATLSGDYELQLYPTDSIYYFYSGITL